MVKEKFNKADMIKYNDEILPLVKDLDPIYSIIARARSHRIKGGDDIKIDIHLTGVGIPDANKFIFLWSSPNVIDSSKPGDCTYCAKVFEAKIGDKDVTFPLADEESYHLKLDATGTMLNLHRGFFLPWPILPPPKGTQPDLPIIVAERDSKGRCPISISLKTLRKAKPGDYTVDIVFTYKHHNIVKQASDKAEFHITSWWDRNQSWIITAGSVIAFILLVLTVINGFIS
jgi:hypothetical protein